MVRIGRKEGISGVHIAPGMIGKKELISGV